MKLFRLTPFAKRILWVLAIGTTWNTALGKHDTPFNVTEMASGAVRVLNATSRIISGVFLSEASASTLKEEGVTKYTRKDWPHWVDEDDDCQNTRNEVLIVASVDTSFLVFKDRIRRCTLVKGKWLDPYSNKVFTDPKQLDIDHVVPLSWAHSHGGASWDKTQKRNFANDFNNLLAVDLSLNRQKGDKGPTEWLPPNFKYRCAYIVKFDFIVNKYHLQYTSSEQRTLKKMQDACAGR